MRELESKLISIIVTGALGYVVRMHMAEFVRDEFAGGVNFDMFLL